MRRPIAAILAGGALLLALAGTTPALAQDQAQGDHPIVGAWQIHPFAGDPTQESLMTFDSDGTLTTVDASGQLGLGAWTASGDRSVDLTFDELAAGPDGSLVGIITIRASGDVSKDGQTFKGEWTIELPEAMAQLMGSPAGELGPGDVTGERISAEAPGEAVGPLPDFTQVAMQSPEPSPEASSAA